MALTTNLLGYWKLDESGTGTAADASGNGLTLTNNGPVTYASAKINNGWDGGAVNLTKWLSRTSACGLDMSMNFTVNLWLNLTTQPALNTPNTIFQIENETTANKKGIIEMQLYNNAGTQMYYERRGDSNGNDQNGVNQTFTVGTWYMLTYTWDGSNHKIYLNGSGTAFNTQASTRTGTNVNVTGNGDFIKIGADDINTRYISGLIDEVGVWNRVLTGTEITTIYNGGAGLQYPFSTVNTGAFMNFM